jgi:hypothetical protein
MKNISTILVYCFTVSVLVFSCKSDQSSKKEDAEIKENLVVSKEMPTLTGEFIHVDTAAVLKVNNKLYGVKMDDMAKSVVEEAEKIKTDDYDVINVIVKAEIMPNPEPEGWEEIVTIKTLDKIYKPEPEQETKVLKYSSNKNE